MTVFRLRGLIAECRQRVGCSRPLLGRANDSFRAGSPDQRTSASGPIPVTGCSPARTSASGRSIRLGRSRLWVGCSRPLLGRTNDSFRAGSPDQRTSAPGPIPVTGCSPGRTSASGRSIRPGRSRLWVDSRPGRPPEAVVRRGRRALTHSNAFNDGIEDRFLAAKRLERPQPAASRRRTRPMPRACSAFPERHTGHIRQSL